MNYWMMNPYLTPRFPRNCDLPPTIYSILESIVNYGKDDKTKIKDLAKIGRSTIFNFDYPLSNNISKEDFESMILNKFLMRRIGFDTLTAFQIQLNVKLNEIMPMYNKLFDSIEGWDLFNDGESIIHTTTGNTTSSLSNTSNNTTTSDRRYSDTPQNQLQAVQSGDYLTDYNYDTTTGNDTSTSNGSSTNIVSEETKKSPSDKIKLYKEMQENIKNIYTMIFSDLEELFYGLC